MTLSASDRIDRMLSGEQIHPFDWVNLPLFYDPKPEEDTEYTNRLRDATKMAYVAANEMGYGLKFRFRPSSMSNGHAAYALAEQNKDKILQATRAKYGEGFLTTQNLKHMVAGSEMMNRIIQPNREQDFRSANKIEGRFPNEAIVVPIEFENVPRSQRGNNALSQGATFQDWTFECWWAPRVMDMSGHVCGGDRPYSRYANIEDLTADMIQCGLLDDYREHVGPGKEFDITDEHGRKVTLADRAWERAKHIVDVVERGFRSDLAVATLVAQFQIDDWLGQGNKGPLDMKKVHPNLTKRSKAEMAQMSRLKKMMLPYIAEKCADWVPYNEDPNLKAYFEKHILPLKDKGRDFDIKKTKRALFAYSPVGAFNNPDYAKESLSRDFDDSAHTTKPAKRRSVDGGYFKDQARLFDDDHFDKLSLWEQAALPYILGAVESFRLPENSPRSMFYIAEPKGGALAKKYMKKHKLDWLKEAYSAEDQKGKNAFSKQVAAKNKAQTPKDVDALAAMEAVQTRDIQNIVSTNNFINIAEAAEKFRNFVAAKGPQKLSPRARLALMMEWMDRNPESIAVRKDWQVHHDETQLMVRALQIATGLVDRPYNGGDCKMEIFAYDQKSQSLEKQDMYDLVTRLGKTVDEMLCKSPPPEAKEHYLSMARMIQILDMYMDPGRMNVKQVSNPVSGAVTSEEIINWRDVDPSLMGFWHEDPVKKAELKEFRNHIREKLLNVGVLYFDENDLEGLGEDYKAAWHEAHGVDAAEKRKKHGERQTFQNWKGPV